MLAPVDYHDQSALELCLHVFCGDVEKANLQIILSRHMVLNHTPFVFEAGIIGASHYLQFRNHKIVYLSEVFACVDLANQKPVYSKSNAGNINFTKDTNFINYHFKSECMAYSMSDGRLNELSEKILSRQNNQMGLSYDFNCIPIDANKNSNQAVAKAKGAQTLIHANWLEDQSKLLVTTAHVYPNEDSVVFTESVFDYSKHAKSHGQLTDNLSNYHLN